MKKGINKLGILALLGSSMLTGRTYSAPVINGGNVETVESESYEEYNGITPADSIPTLGELSIDRGCYKNGKDNNALSFQNYGPVELTDLIGEWRIVSEETIDSKRNYRDFGLEGRMIFNPDQTYSLNNNGFETNGSFLPFPGNYIRFGNLEENLLGEGRFNDAFITLKGEDRLIIVYPGFPKKTVLERVDD